METHGVGDLELLALANVGRLGDSSLESVEGLVVERLQMQSQTLFGRCQFRFQSAALARFWTYLGAGHGHLDLAPRR